MNAAAVTVVALTTLAIAAAAGCAAEPESNANPTASAVVTSSTPTPSPTPTPTPTKDAIAACSIFGDGGSRSVMQRIPIALTSIGASLTSDQLDELLAINDALTDAIAVAPTDLAGALTSLNVPFQQAADVMDAGGGSLSMDTASVASDVTEVMTLCVGAGYTVSGATAAADTGSLLAAVEEALAPWPAVTAVTQTEPGRISVATSIVDPRGDDGSPEALDAIAICEAAASTGATYVSVMEADGTHFVLYGHPSYPAGQCTEV